MSEDGIKVYIGNAIHCNKPFSVSVLEKSFIAVKKTKIIAIGDVSSLEQFKREHEKCVIDEVVLNEYQILIPGLIDTHNHAGQYANLGLGLNQPLYEWLETHTFALEEKLADLDLARKCFDVVVRQTLNHGTTTVAYNSIVDTDASLILADIVIARGQRAFVGKVNITAKCVESLRESADATIDDTKRFISVMMNKNNTLVQPIISPSHPFRMSIDTLKELTSLAKTHSLRIQTHLCECEGEPEEAHKVYNKSLGEILVESGLLTDKTIIAHAVHLTSKEIQELAKHKTSVAHCPGSNFNLLSGVCDVKTLFKAGIDVGLGTDISAGSNVGITDQMRNALIASSTIYFNDKNRKLIDCYDAFYMATLGGAKALSIDEIVGNFEVGKDFDALIVDMNVKNGNSTCLFSYEPLELLQKFIYLGDDRNIISVFVAGRNVKC
ncbi:hypothetical protein FQR65_LT07849 [Abscondita terminalis]|nr:hypothetical protein FQR65_LT07849 [Abscondita terminalis]